jgi:copper chaperone NosL
MKNRHPLMNAVLVAGIAVLAACSAGVAQHAIEPSAGAACSLDGMLLADFPGPKGEIVYERGEPDFFCDTVEMFSLYLQPEQVKRVVGVYTQDMGEADWEHPKGHWIDAKRAYYVLGSRRTGSMGPTIGAFAREADARAFAQQNGGRVLRFDDVKPDMVTLDGGVMKDGKM